MVLDAPGCYQAVCTHDRRFDGLFFVGVTSTGVYCRPVCRVRTPRAENCRFFPNAASAERAGFRPCLRCRPELAPGHSRTDAVSRLAVRAMQRIEEGALNERSVDDLAAELDVSGRHLRRALEAEFGVGPVELAQTQRLLTAKQLLTDTALPVTDVAFASGFASVRRFNGLFRARYRLTPTEVRRSGGRGTPQDRLVFELSYRPPFAWDALLGFLAVRATRGVEVVEGSRYARTLSVGMRTGWLVAEPLEGAHALRVEVSGSLARAVPAVLARVRRLFDLQAEPTRIDECLSADPLLAPLVRATPGLRLPGAVDGFETAVRAILGQQVSVKAATTLAGRVVAAFGQEVETPIAGLTHLAPTAARLAATSREAWEGLGLTGARVESLRSLAKAVADGGVRLQPGGDVEATVARLRELPGIGPWTAEYIAMRALHWPDAFLATDLGIRKALAGLAPGSLPARADGWRPWRSYAVLHLWRGLEAE